VPTLVAMLRGINLGSHNRLSMADLKAVVESLGGEHVRTYVQSGNVVFDGPLAARAGAAGEISAALKKVNGLEVEVVTRSAAELAAMVATPRFPDVEPQARHVTFLDRQPAAERLTSIDAARFAPDEFEVAGRDVYLHLPDGYGRSKLSNAFFEKRLGVVATTRNWRTVTALAELSAKNG
jgi:uncharacterized protein (DUF1697 family)